MVGCRGVCSMKSLNKVWAMGKMCSRLPTVMSSIIALPFDEILILAVILMTIQDAFDFVLQHIINLYQRWRGWV